LIIKQGLDYIDSASSQGVSSQFTGTEESAAILKNLLIAAPPEELEKITPLFQTLEQLRHAEEAYIGKISQARNSAAASIMSVMSLSQASRQIFLLLDNIVMVRSNDVYIHKQPDEARSKRASSSSNLKDLRTAYETYRIWNTLFLTAYLSSYQVQLYMHGAVSTPSHFPPSAEKVNKAVTDFHRLPDLSAKDMQTLTILTMVFQKANDSFRAAIESLDQKNEALAVLEEAAKAALQQSAELRDYFIRRLAEI